MSVALEETIYFLGVRLVSWRFSTRHTRGFRYQDSCHPSYLYLLVFPSHLLMHRCRQLVFGCRDCIYKRFQADASVHPVVTGAYIDQDNEVK